MSFAFLATAPACGRPRSGITPESTAEAVLDTIDLRPGGRAGLIMFGEDYAWMGLEQQGTERMLVVRSVERAQDSQAETAVFGEPWSAAKLTMRVSVTKGAQFRFAVVNDGKVRDVGRRFQAKPGRWVGAKMGLFASAPPGAADTGWASFARFTVSPPR